MDKVMEGIDELGTLLIFSESVGSRMFSPGQ